ncbi:MAG: glycosyltransferase family 9 protein [Sumerlaeia bacterium]
MATDFPADSTPPRRILFCARPGIGDLVMETPLLEALARAFPGAEVTLLAGRRAAELFAFDARIGAVAVREDLGIAEFDVLGTEEDYERLGRWLDEEAFDLIANGNNAPYPLRVAVRRRPGLARLDEDRAAEEAALAHGANGVEAIAAAARAGWGLEVNAGDFSVPERERSFWYMGDVHSSEWLGLQPYLVILPKCGRGIKAWPENKWSTLIAIILRETNCSVFLMAGNSPEDFPYLLSKWGYPYPLRGRVIFNRILWEDKIFANKRDARFYLAAAALVIGADTGLLHLAAALGTPVVGIYGPTDPAVYLPPGARNASAGPPEDGCPHRRPRSLRHPECWREDRCLIAEAPCTHAVGVLEVWERARAILPPEALNTGRARRV